MEKVREDFQTLYKREEPQHLGLPLDTHVDPSKANYKIPSVAEVEAAVRCLGPHRAGGHSNLRAEHLKQCQWETYPGEQLKTPPHRGAMDMPVRPSLVHVAHRGDPPGVGMDGPGPDSKGDHRHKMYRLVRDPVEGGGGADRHSPLHQPADARHPSRVQGKKRDRYGYNGAKSCPGARQYRPGPPLPGIPGP